MLHFLPLADDADREPFVAVFVPQRHMADHLAYVRSRGCAVTARRPNAVRTACRCSGPIEAHHVRTAANSGMGLKPPDSCAVGLCRSHHRALHDLGRKTFEGSYGLDLAAIAARLWAEDKEQHGEMP